MKLLRRHLTRVALAVCGAMVMALALNSVHADGYSFKVHNKAGQAITKMLASEDGKNWGHFDIGDGIAPGQTVKIVWSKSTEDESCEQYFKAVFEDGSQTAPAKFDFCDPDVVLEVTGGHSDGYSFKVHNKGGQAVTKMLASEDGKTWGRFDIGDGIAPRQTVKIVWSKTTEDESCEQYFKVVFEDGSETAPAKFDFCDPDVVLEVSDD